MSSTKKTYNLLVIRLLILTIILSECLVILGWTPFTETGLTWYWIAYTSCSYLILYELPIFLLRYSEYQYLYIPVGYIFAFNLFLDAVGNIFNLFNLTAYYDDFMHTTLFPWNITAISVALSAIFCKKNNLTSVPKLILYLGFTTAVTLMVFHEIIEMFIDWVTLSNAGTGALDIDDTGRDLLSDMIGSLLFIAIFWCFCKKRWLEILRRKA